MAITTRRPMAERTTGFEANGANHPADRTPRNAAKLNLTPCFPPPRMVTDGHARHRACRAASARLYCVRLLGMPLNSSGGVLPAR